MLTGPRLVIHEWPSCAKQKLVSLNHFQDENLCGSSLEFRNADPRHDMVYISWRSSQRVPCSTEFSGDVQGVWRCHQVDFQHPAWTLYWFIHSAWHGFQIEDATQFHIVVVWHSYLHLTTASKDSYYPNLPPITDSALQRKLFDINEYPEAALAAPITDMTFMFLKDGYAFEKDVKPLLIRFTELGDDTGAIGTYWGEATESEGMSIVVIGWDSVQVEITSIFRVRFSDHSYVQQHYDCGKQPAYKELNDSAVPVVNFDLKHVEFEQSF